MYAIVTIAGQQFKVEKGSKVIVHQLQSNVGDEVTFEKVLLIDNDGKISVGTPYVKDAAVSAQVVSHLRGDKIKVFKKKRRKGYQVLNGHRQYFTEILIDEIIASGFVKKEPKPKKAEAKPAQVIADSQPVAAEEKPAKQATKKAAEPKKEAAKEKPAAKKTVKKESTEKAKPEAKKTAAKSKPVAKKEDKTKK